MSQANYNEAICTSKYISAENGYETSLIDQLIKKHREKDSQNSFNNITLTRDLKNKLQTKYIPTVYDNILPNILRSKLQKINATVAFRTSNNTQKILREKQHLPPKTNQEYID